jgi:hypothetical protein
MIATYQIAPSEYTVQVGGSVPFIVTGSGIMATINGNAPTWTNLTGCALQPDSSLKDTASGSGWGLAGAESSETITLGDGYVNWIANTEPAIPGVYPEFGGRQWFAGLTSQTGITSFTDIDFGLQVFEGGVAVYETGVQKRIARAARNGGLYQVGIENGLVIYRADGDVIYRSGTPITYPQRFGVAFLNHGADHIGGNPAFPGTLSAKDANGNPAGSWFLNSWTAPNVPGRYTVTAATSNNLFAHATVDVQAIFPRWDDPLLSLVRPKRFTPLPPEEAMDELVFADLGGEYNANYPDKNLLAWRLEFEGLNETEAALLDAFYAQHKRTRAFYFYDWRDSGYTGELYNNCRFRRYDRTHNRVVWQSRTIEIVRRPV